MDRFMDAALARRDAVRAPADRPSQRRSAEAAGSLAVVRFAAVTTLRKKAEPADDGMLHFEGIASATERAYEMWDMFGPYNEIVSASAFDETLNRADLDVPLVLGHDQLRRIARTTNGSLALDMTSEGLRAVAPSLDPADADVAYIAPKMQAGLIDEMSFAFRIDSGRWSPDYTEFRIEKVDIHRGDVSIVGWGANPYTSGGLRSRSPKSGHQVVTDDDLTGYRAL